MPLGFGVEMAAFSAGVGAGAEQRRVSSSEVTLCARLAWPWFAALREAAFADVSESYLPGAAGGRLAASEPMQPLI